MRCRLAADMVIRQSVWPRGLWSRSLWRDIVRHSATNDGNTSSHMIPYRLSRTDLLDTENNKKLQEIIRLVGACARNPSRGAIGSRDVISDVTIRSSCPLRPSKLFTKQHSLSPVVSETAQYSHTHDVPNATKVHTPTHLLAGKISKREQESLVNANVKRATAVHV